MSIVSDNTHGFAAWRVAAPASLSPGTWTLVEQMQRLCVAQVTCTPEALRL